MQIGQHHIPEQGSLADAGLAKDRHVLPANISGDGDEVIVLLFCAEEDFHEGLENNYKLLK